MIQKNNNLLPQICKLFYCIPDDVKSIERDQSNDEFHVNLKFKTGRNWTEIYFTSGSIDYQSQEKEDPAGIVSEQVLKFIVPGEDETSEESLKIFRQQSVIIRMEYVTGKSKLVGDLLHFPSVLKKVSFSSKMTGSEMNVSLVSTDPAPWITTQ